MEFEGVMPAPEAGILQGQITDHSTSEYQMQVTLQWLESKEPIYSESHESIMSPKQPVPSMVSFGTGETGKRSASVDDCEGLSISCSSDLDSETIRVHSASASQVPQTGPAIASLGPSSLAPTAPNCPLDAARTSPFQFNSTRVNGNWQQPRLQSSSRVPSNGSVAAVSKRGIRSNHLQQWANLSTRSDFLSLEDFPWRAIKNIPSPLAR
jgi:hypothetical protein